MAGHVDSMKVSVEAHCRRSLSQLRSSHLTLRHSIAKGRRLYQPPPPLAPQTPSLNPTPGPVRHNGLFFSSFFSVPSRHRHTHTYTPFHFSATVTSGGCSGPLLVVRHHGRIIASGKKKLVMWCSWLHRRETHHPHPKPSSCARPRTSTPSHLQQNVGTGYLALTGVSLSIWTRYVSGREPRASINGRPWRHQRLARTQRNSFQNFDRPKHTHSLSRSDNAEELFCHHP